MGKVFHLKINKDYFVKIVTVHVSVVVVDFLIKSQELYFSVMFMILMSS